VDVKFHLSFDEKKEFIFWGNHFFTQENFLENILMYGKSSWHFPGAILSDEIESMYKAKGFWDVQVCVKEESGKTFCMIDEGKRAVLQKIEIKDNFHISTQKIASECFALVQEKPFDRDLFSLAIQHLKKLYMEQGFWDVKILKEEFIKLPEQIQYPQFNHYKAALMIDEGAVRSLQSVEVAGYSEFSSQGPFEQFFNLKQAVPFHHSWIYTQKSWLINYFKDLGHHKVLVHHELTGPLDAMHLVWHIELDEKQVHFGKLVISGNSKIPFKLLQRELRIEQGQLWDKNKIEKSLANLRGLDLFDTTHIYSYKEIDDQGQIPVGVKLIDADKYEMRARLGCQQVGKDFSLQQGFSYKVGGTAIFNNPFKYGDRAIIEADFTKFYENFSMQYLMPWLFTRPIRSQIKLYDNHYLQPLFIGSDVSIYNAFQQGILFGLQEKHEHVNLGMSVGLEFKGIAKANIEDIAISIDYNPSLFAKKFAYFFAQPSLMWTNVDNIVNPKSGSNALISVLGMADLQNQTSLFKLLGEYALYVPFSLRTVCAIRTRIGHIFNRQYTDILPIDRFYLGGANTIRGYDRDYCPPLGLLTKPIYAPDVGLPPAADDLWWYVPQGGRTMINCNFEVRFPLYDQLQGAAFLDAGVLVKDSMMQDVPDNLLGGAGFGFRYNTPIGPIRFDLAFKLDRKYPEFESPYVWYLTLGQAF
jgi:outer membrane protein insertion porin family